MKLASARQIVQDAARTLLSTHHWKARLVLWSAGAAVGGAAVATAVSKLLSPPLYQTLAQRYAQ